MISRELLEHVIDRLETDLAQIPRAKRAAFLEALRSLLREAEAPDAPDALPMLTALYTRHGLRAPDPHRAALQSSEDALRGGERGDRRSTQYGATSRWELLRRVEDKIRELARPAEPARVWPDARAPAEVVVGEEFLVEAQVRGRPGGAGDPHGLPVTPTPAGRLEVWVHAVLDEGMRASTPLEALAVTESGKDSAIVAFRVVATRPGAHRVRVIFDAHAAATEIALSVAALVKEAGPSGRVEKSSTLVLIQHPPGVVLLKVRKIGEDARRLDLRLTLIRDGHTLARETVSIKRDELTEVQSGLIGLGERFDVTNPTAWRAYAVAEGRHLTRMLLPGLAPVLASMPEGTALHVECIDADVPFELALLHPSGADQFLGERFAVSRAFFDTPMGSDALGGRAVLVLDAKAGFDLTNEKAGLAAVSGAPAELRTGFAEALALESAPAPYGFVHFAVHGDADPARPGSQVLRFSDGELAPRLLPDTNRALAGALVFLNACRTGATRAMLDPEGGFFHAFARAGAGAVVAPHWSVVSSVAGQMARDVYTAIANTAAAKGLLLAEAVRRARCADPTQPDRLAYIVYCRPGCRVGP